MARHSSVGNVILSRRDGEGSQVEASAYFLRSFVVYTIQDDVVSICAIRATKTIATITAVESATRVAQPAATAFPRGSAECGARRECAHHRDRSGGQCGHRGGEIGRRPAFPIDGHAGGGR